MAGHRLRAVCAIVVVAGFALPAGASAAHGSDQASQAKDLPFSELDLTNTTGFTTQAGEPLTCDGTGMGATAWYKVKGSGRPIEISTAGSDFDTLLAVYGIGSGLPEASDQIACDDDVNFPSDLTSNVVFDSSVTETYLVQAGGFGGAVGSLNIVATTPPLMNDERTSAEAVTAESPLIVRDNFGASVDGAEDLDCEGAPLGSTMWFQFDVAQHGRATFQTGGPTTGGGFDTVMQLYQGSSDTPLACADDVGELESQITEDLSPGTYFIQVGGFGGAEGRFTFDVASFIVDLDVDGDGHNRPADCNDNNRNIHPGRPDPTNGLDDNCDGITDPDRDGDGFARPPLGRDCNDGNSRIYPGANDVPGNRVNEDCAGGLREFPRIEALPELRGTAGRRFRIRSLKVEGVPDGAKVQARCHGPRRGGRRASCGSKSVVAKTVSLTSRFRGSRLRAGSILVIRVTKPGHIGYYRKFTIRSFRAPRKSAPRCMNPGSLRVLRTCPGIK